MSGEPTFREQTARVESLIDDIERRGDAQTVGAARAVLRAALDLHATGLERVLAIAKGHGAGGPELVAALGADEVVGSLLMLHGLHPVDLATRARRALAELSGELGDAGTAEMASASDGVVRVRLRVKRGGDAAALRARIEEALCAAAPDAAGVEIDGPAPGLLPAEHLVRGRDVARGPL